MICGWHACNKALDVRWQIEWQKILKSTYTHPVCAVCAGRKSSRPSPGPWSCCRCRDFSRRPWPDHETERNGKKHKNKQAKYQGARCTMDGCCRQSCRALACTSRSKRVIFSRLPYPQTSKIIFACISWIASDTGQIQHVSLRTGTACGARNNLCMFFFRRDAF